MPIKPPIGQREVDDDPVIKLLQCIDDSSIRHVKGEKRDRMIARLLLGVIADPTHPIGKIVGYEIVRKWFERGGKIPQAVIDYVVKKKRLDKTT